MGAVFVSGASFGPVFTDVSFVSNSAQVGGAVSVFGSGNSRTATTLEPPDPTTFDRCRFVDNRAEATGGALESAAGQDSFIDCVFEDNESRVGGALRLAGTATVVNCSFVDNVSEDAGGAAVSNIGFVSEMANSSFRGNAFSCRPGLFLNYTTVSRMTRSHGAVVFAGLPSTQVSICLCFHCYLAAMQRQK